MLGTRLVTGFLMAGFLIAVLILDERLAPWFPLWLVLSLVATGAAALELVGLLNETSARPSGNTVFGGVIALVLANWAPHVAGVVHRLPHLAGRPAYDPLSPVNALAWPLLTFAAVVMVTFIAQSVQFEKPGATMATIAGTVLAVAYVGLLGSFVIQMRWLDGPYHGLVPLAFLFTTAKGADTGAYTLGRLAGRHKLWPRLSPNKTVEGALGGLLFGVAGALLVDGLARALLGVVPMGWGRAIAFGLVVGTAAQLGDLMESMIKRDCARKDASAAVPGFGGVLDVLDSLLFAGPVAFGFWLWAGV
jgi:phosphatidate cytidylyltransferase